MTDEIVSRRVTGVRTTRLPNEPETVFITFAITSGEKYTFHMQTSDMANMATQMLADAKALTQ
ncbi:MAG: hypothetical protein AAGH83_11110 [Pseudomonadota bacterium]